MPQASRAKAVLSAPHKHCWSRQAGIVRLCMQPIEALWGEHTKAAHP